MSAIKSYYSSLLKGIGTVAFTLCLGLASTTPFAADKQRLDEAKKSVRIKNFTHAANLYQRLADKGNAEAQYQLANMLRSGLGIEKNPQQAFVWFKKSAQQGHKEAQYTLAILYETGSGVASNAKKSIYWHQKAAKNGHRKAKKKLQQIAKGNDTEDKKSPQTLAKELRHAAAKGDLKRVRRLLKKQNILDLTDAVGRTALIEASITDQHRVIVLLAENGANVDHINQFGDAALHIATTAGFIDTVKTLINHQANINLQDKNGNTPLMLAVLGDQQKIATLLLQNNSRLDILNKNKESAIVMADDKKRKAMLALLKRYGAKLPKKEQRASINLKNIQQPNPLYKGWSPLAIAAWRGQYLSVKKLIEDGNNINQTDEEGKTALIHAALKGHKKITVLLLKHGANPNLVTRKNATALHFAVAQENEPLVKALLRAQSRVNIADHNGNTALHIAAEKGNVPLTRRLLAKDKSTINWKNKAEKTALIIAVEHAYADISASLIDAGADIHALRADQHTLLQIAAENNALPIIKQLYRQGIHLNQAVVSDNTPLMIAAFRGYIPILQYLTKNNAKINTKNTQENTALMLAAMANQTAAVKYLLEHGANPSLRNKKREQAIDFSKQHHNNELQRLLKSNMKKRSFFSQFK